MSELQLKSLLEGLEVPNYEWWKTQPPEALLKLGEAIANQAKRAEGARDK